MNATVAICTWNRAKLLDQTLEQMRQLRIPDGVQWELLVVNNNCTDDTDAVLQRHADHLPLRRLFESKQGHSNARNCAVAAARGELLVWTDDDVLVDTEWLSAYAEAARLWPAAAFFAGQVDPWFSREPPRWIRDHIEQLSFPYAIASRDPSVRPLGAGERPVGASMGFRTQILRSYPFDPILGRRGAALIHGDDNELIDRLYRDGHCGVWVGTARLHHYIQPVRLTERYIWDWHVGLGRSYLRQGRRTFSGHRLWGVPRWLYRQYGQELLRATLHRPGRGPRWFASFRQAAILRGMIVEFRDRHRLEGSVAVPTSISVDEADPTASRIPVGM